MRDLSPVYFDKSADEFTEPRADDKFINNPDVSFDSISDLMDYDIANSPSTKTANVLGFYSAGDAGGGGFYWDANKNKADHNGGTIINPGHNSTIGSSNWYSSTGDSTDDSDSGCWVRPVKDRVNIEWFGAIADNSTVYTKAIQSAIDYLSTSPFSGGEIYFHGSKNWMIDGKIYLKDRVSLIGTGRSGEIKASSGFPDSSMVECVKDIGSTESMFHSFIKKITINGNREPNLRELILSRAWQENCGLQNVLLRGFVDRGVTIQDGFGGAAYLKFENIEMFPSGSGTNYGIYVDEISSVGGFIFHVNGATIASSSGNDIDTCIYMKNDHLLLDGFHIEYATNGVVLDNDASLNAKSCSGSFNDVTNLFKTLPTWTGKTIKLDTIFKNGSTNILKDEVNGKNISKSFLTSFSYDNSYNDSLRSVGIDIPDNSFSKLPLITDDDSSVLIITINSQTVADSALIHVRPDSSNPQINIISQSGTRFEVGTGAPSGTTSSDSKVGIYTGDNDGEIYVENRIGFTAKFQYTLFR